MTKRIQIPVEAAEADLYRRAARRAGLPMAEWARRLLRSGAERELGPGARSPSEALSAMFALEAPVADVEVLQEILHRYRVLSVPDTGTALCDAVLDIGIPVLPVTESGLRRARTLLDDAPQLSTRDAVHVGVMLEHGISRVLSYDRGFDGLAGIERLEP